jgi:hypothetical protein
LGCRGPRISLNLYLAIALALAVLLGLAGAHIKFAAETIRAAHRVQGKGLQALGRVGRAEVLLSDLRRLVDAASLGPHPAIGCGRRRGLPGHLRRIG